MLCGSRALKSGNFPVNIQVKCALQVIVNEIPLLSVVENVLSALWLASVGVGAGVLPSL